MQNINGYVKERKHEEGQSYDMNERQQVSSSGPDTVIVRGGRDFV